MKVSKLKVCNTSLLAMASGLNICAFVENDKPLTAIIAVGFGAAATLSAVDTISQAKKEENIEKRQNNKSVRITKRLAK